MSLPVMAHVCPLSVALAPFSEKRIARASNTHPKTAARWKRSETQPSAPALLEMMRSDDDVFLAVLRAIGRDDFANRTEAAQHLARAIAALEGRK
jgi:hypothetical protein